jgi:hypothetical protein
MAICKLCVGYAIGLCYGQHNSRPIYCEVRETALCVMNDKQIIRFY